MALTPRSFVVPASLLAAGFCSAATGGEPQVVQQALEAIELCIHWGGEEPYDAKRRRTITEGIDRDCPEARRMAALAHQAYPDNEQLAEALLTLHDFGYFELTKEEKQRVCQSALPRFRKQFEESGLEDPLFESRCPEQAKTIYSR